MSNESQVNNCWLFECDYFGVLCILFQLLTKTGNFLQCVKEIGQLMIENSNGSSDVGIGKLIESIKFRFYLTSLLFVFFLLLPCFVLFCFVYFLSCSTRVARGAESLNFENIWNHIFGVIFTSLMNGKMNGGSGDEYLTLTIDNKRNYFETNLKDYLVQQLPLIDSNRPQIRMLLLDVNRSTSH